MIYEGKNIWKCEVRIYSIKLFDCFMNIMRKAVEDGVISKAASYLAR